MQSEFGYMWPAKNILISSLPKDIDCSLTSSNFDNFPRSKAHAARVRKFVISSSADIRLPHTQIVGSIWQNNFQWIGFYPNTNPGARIDSWSVAKILYFDYRRNVRCVGFRDPSTFNQKVGSVLRLPDAAVFPKCPKQAAQSNQGQQRADFGPMRHHVLGDQVLLRDGIAFAIGLFGSIVAFIFGRASEIKRNLTIALTSYGACIGLFLLALVIFAR